MKGIQPTVKALIDKFKKAKGVERDSIRAKIKDAIRRDPKDLKASIAKMMEIHPAMIGADILIDTLMGVLMEEGLIAEIGAGPVGSLEKIAQEYRKAKEGVEKERLRAMARKMAQGKPDNVKKMIAGKMGIYPRMLGASEMVDRIDLLIGEAAHIDTNEYEFSHGGKPGSKAVQKKLGQDPEISGMWAFKIGGEQEHIRGTWKEASQKARQIAKKKGVSSIKVLP